MALKDYNTEVSIWKRQMYDMIRPPLCYLLFTIEKSHLICIKTKKIWSRLFHKTFFYLYTWNFRQSPTTLLLTLLNRIKLHFIIEITLFPYDLRLKYLPSPTWHPWWTPRPRHRRWRPHRWTSPVWQSSWRAHMVAVWSSLGPVPPLRWHRQAAPAIKPLF